MVRVSLLDLLQDVDLQIGCFPVFLQVLNDLQRDRSPSAVGRDNALQRKDVTGTCDRWLYLLRSKHCTTFPKVPSPNVSTIWSEKQIYGGEVCLDRAVAVTLR